MRKWLGFSLFVTSLMIAAQSALALPPSVIWIRPTNGAVFTANSTILLTARAVATNSTVGVVEFYANSNLVGMVAASPTNATGIYNFSWPNVAAGVYRLHAEAVNNLGERGVSGSVQITVNTNTPPPPTNAVPVVNWIRPTNGAVFPPGAAIFMTATATDSDGSISFVDFFANSTSWGAGRGRHRVAFIISFGRMRLRASTVSMPRRWTTPVPAAVRASCRLRSAAAPTTFLPRSSASRKARL